MAASSLFLAALKGQNQGRTPIWLMRQAGRYMLSYRAMRSQHDFLSICHNPDLITKVTLQPIQRFGFDAAIIFSDILIILEALGYSIHFEEGHGPLVTGQLTNQHIVKIPQRLTFVGEGIRRLISKLSVPLIGFVGGPFTVASYIVGGSSGRELSKFKQKLFQDPGAMHHLLAMITEASIAYLELQIKAGASAIQIFDTWAGSLAPTEFQSFACTYLAPLIQAVQSYGVPVILFTQNTAAHIDALAGLSPDAISCDWTCNPLDIRKRIGLNIALQGNLDPHLLLGEETEMLRQARHLLDMMADDQGFIFNLGHGVLPTTPESSVEALVKLVQEKATLAHANH